MKKLLLLLFVMVALGACKKDKDDDKPLTPSSSVVIGGTTQKVSSTTSFVSHDVQQGQVGRALLIQFYIGQSLLEIVASVWDWQNPPDKLLIEKTYYSETSKAVCKDFGNFTMCDDASAAYTNIYTFEGYISYDADFEDSPGSITITSMDDAKQIASGSFEFLLYNEEDENDSITVSGSFSNIKYVYQL